MTDEQIIKALECCTIKEMDCKNCPNKNQGIHCIYETMKPALDLIKRQNEEIERLRQPMLLIESNKLSEKELINAMKMGKVGIISVGESSVKRIDEEGIKTKAIKEFAERLKEISYIPNLSLTGEKIIDLSDIDNLVKEMKEQDNG